MPLSDRLMKVLEMGDTLALFPLLKDWSAEELQALLQDVEAFNEEAAKRINGVWQEEAMLPEVFFNPVMSKKLDKTRDDVLMETLFMCSEICSVAIYYLHEKGIEYYGDEEENCNPSS